MQQVYDDLHIPVALKHLVLQCIGVLSGQFTQQLDALHLIVFSPAHYVWHYISLETVVHRVRVQRYSLNFKSHKRQMKAQYFLAFDAYAT